MRRFITKTFSCELTHSVFNRGLCKASIHNSMEGVGGLNVDCDKMCLQYFSHRQIFREQTIEVYSIMDFTSLLDHPVLWLPEHLTNSHTLRAYHTPCCRSVSFPAGCWSQENTSISQTPTPVVIKSACAANMKTCPSLRYPPP